MLRTGSLPASISYLETRTVGPSLGAASIHQGVVAAVAGMLAVMAFMLLYYRGAGINADLALVLNLVILLGFMGFTSATLTLPGIAGVILTIGMGVDSNVLIFERIREELRLGKSSAAAVQDGFAHAWITIIDTHITTIVSAGILFLFGTGPVKGFAVTLTFGLLANLFTAVFVSRVIFDYLLSKRGRDGGVVDLESSFQLPAPSSSRPEWPVMKQQDARMSSEPELEARGYKWNCFAVSISTGWGRSGTSSASP